MPSSRHSARSALRVSLKVSRLVRDRSWLSGCKRRVNGREFLQTSHTRETLDRNFSSSERQVRVLNPVVEPPRSSTFQSESGNRTYSITAKRMISGLDLKYLKVESLLMPKRYANPLPRSSKVNLTRTFAATIKLQSLSCGFEFIYSEED